ncbi:hypothetical protein [Devosia sp. SL43]|uniref:hypothetical protein n=1 Tax=Devosia sp. SL43 TaxID=2806348 RepID=UPI001F302033|nr:hypothetical protein [Devosia sp. SL43]UJW84644.1 hypothetical protein IM737_14590 [Devosia sp. SL43]
MIRPIAALAFIALGLGAATAQDALPAQPATPEVVVDPTATIDNTPKQANLLTGLYATKAVIEICAVPVEANILAGIAADQARLEASLAMDPATAEKAYSQVKADVEKTTPDCAEGSPDRISVDAVTAIYSAQAAASPNGGATPAAPAPTATPATPATPADPAAPAAVPAEPATSAQ